MTSRSLWYQFRRVQYPTIINIAIGELRASDQFEYCVDINCTLRRSYRIRLSSIPEADNFLVALSRFSTVKIVPTVEEEMREQRDLEELQASHEANAASRQRRMEILARQQNELLSTLLQVECAPRISFGTIY